MILVLVVLLTSSAATAATSSSAAGATILTPITLSNTVGLEFGQFGISASPGTVRVSTAGVRFGTGGVTLAGVVPITGASFDVAGAPGSTYTVKLPASASIVLGADAMTVDTFASSPDTTGTLSGAGTDTLVVGATLHVGASQAAGRYAGSFAVTISYD
jgi:hypothetical protein